MTKINRKNKNKRKITVYSSVSVLGSILGDPFYYGILVQGGQKVDLREILDELTNQLDSIGEKMKSADSWQKDQLARNMLTNLEINNKNEVSYRWKKPLEHIFSNASTEEFRSGAPD